MRAMRCATAATRPPLARRTDRAEEALIRAAQRGDASAFATLVRRYQTRVRNLASRLVGDADAPDVAQETFIRLHRSLTRFRGDSALYTWLYRITVNACKNHLAKRAHRPAGQDIDAFTSGQCEHVEQLSDRQTPESIVLADELERRIGRTLSRLTPELRHVIVLREFRQCSYAEMASLMRCPVGTIRSRLFRARGAIDQIAGFRA